MQPLHVQTSLIITHFTANSMGHMSVILNKRKNVKSFLSLTAHKAALIFVS